MLDLSKPVVDKTQLAVFAADTLIVDFALMLGEVSIHMTDMQQKETVLLLNSARNWRKQFNAPKN